MSGWFGQFLPTFNTNSIEQWLYNTPGLPGEIFIHMNDDYLFVGPVNCGGDGGGPPPLPPSMHCTSNIQQHQPQ